MWANRSNVARIKGHKKLTQIQLRRYALPPSQLLKTPYFKQRAKAAIAKAKKSYEPKVTTKLIKRLNQQQKLRILLHRFGSISDFTDVKESVYRVAKNMNLAHATVYNALKRFSVKQMSVEDFLRNKQKMERFQKMSARLKEWLVKPELLQVWASYSLMERVRIVQNVFKEYLTTTALRLFYRHHNIAYLSTNAMKVIEMANNPALEIERKSFAQIIASVIAANLPLVYIDETTANSFMCAAKTWSKRGSRVNIAVANTRYHCTLYACVSANCLLQPVYMVRELTTNQVDFRAFL